MLTIDTDSTEVFDETINEFKTVKGMSIQMEHSLLSLSKWESKWHKSFLHDEKTPEESLDYIKCMVINHNVPDYIFNLLQEQHLSKIMDYIQEPMTATTINVQQNTKPQHKIITAEIIYYWMIAMNIPIEFQKWHLNKLLMLIQVCSIEQAPKKNMSRREIMSQNKSLNAARRAKLRSKG